MTAERDTLAALLGYALDEEASIPALGLESVAHRVADRLIAAGVRVALTAFACEPCWDFIAAHHVSLDAPHASPERP